MNKIQRTGFVVCALLVAACGQPGTTYNGNLLTYLIGLDQLPAVGFSIVDAPHHITASQFASSAQDGPISDSAQARYFRNVGDFAASNGPIDIVTSIARSPSASDAHTVFAEVSSGLDHEANAVAVSSGPLGDESHATTRVASVQSVQAIEVDVVWRIGNLVNRVTVRGRYGGARLEDAITLADIQVNNELAGGRPSPTTRATAAPTPTP